MNIESKLTNRLEFLSNHSPVQVTHGTQVKKKKTLKQVSQIGSHY